ncbi:MAG: molecular chaperone DnaJ [Anaeromyxobacter sp.]
MARILLAEGHSETRELLAGRLAEAGLDVVQAADVARAWEAAQAGRPDLVVLSADLDDCVGLATRLRAADPRVLVVAVDRQHLGEARGVHALLPLRAGAYVADPTSPELVEKVRQLLAQRAAGGKSPLRGAALVLSREPAARGEVKTGVVARLLHQLWRNRSNGILVLEEPGRTRRLLVLLGAPVAVVSDDPGEAMLRWLRDQGRLNAAAHDAVLEAMASGQPAVEALVAAGVLDQGEPLQATLRAHQKALAVRAVAVRQGQWRFHAGAEHAAEVQPLELLPLQIILEGARGGIPARHFAEALRAVTDAYPARTAEFDALLPAAGLGGADLRLALAIDGSLSTRAFVESRGAADMKDALLLLWFLSMVGAVAFHQAPAGEAPAEAPAAPRRPPLPAERAEALRQAALRIVPGSYYHALGVDIAADAAEVERAFREVGSRWHADQFAAYDTGDLSDLLAAVQDKVNAAYRVLSSDEKRRGYLSFLLLRFELSGVRRPGIDVDAEVAFKRGERALRERKPAAALGALREAARRNPREPEYAALLAFATLHDPTLGPAERAEEARRAARQALELAPEHARTRAVAALAEAAAGDRAAARKHVAEGLRSHPDSELLKKVAERVRA